MKPFDNPKKKTYCYKTECNIVQSGFQAKENFFYTCTICKEEVSSPLKNTIDSRNKKLAEDSTVEDDWDAQQYFNLP